MLVTESSTFLGNTIWYNIDTANAVFNWDTKCTEQMNNNFSLLSDLMNRLDRNIHWSYIMQHDVT